LLWQQNVNGIANGFGQASSVAVDQHGNVLAAGSTKNIGTDLDFTVAKFAPNGTLLWQQHLNGPANGADTALSVAVDKQGNVLAGGEDRRVGSDFTVVELAHNGNMLWQQQLNVTACDTDTVPSYA